MAHLIETTGGPAQSPLVSLMGRRSQQFARAARTLAATLRAGAANRRRNLRGLPERWARVQPTVESLVNGALAWTTRAADLTRSPHRLLLYLYAVGPIFLVVLLSAVVVAFLFVRLAADELSRQSEERSAVEAAHISRIFYYTVWLPAHMQVSDLPFERTVHPRIMEVFAQRSASGLDVVKLNAWGLDGGLKWSSDPSNADGRTGSADWYDTVVNQGVPLSELVRDQQIVDLDGETRVLHIVRTYYPVRSAAPDSAEVGEIVGVLDITQDVTAAVNEASSNALRTAVWGAFGIGVVLFALMSLIHLRVDPRVSWTLGRRGQPHQISMQQHAQSAKLATIGELVAGVAHELNNPLTGIWGIANRLVNRLDGDDVDPKLKRELSLINAESERSVRIVQNLLTFARARGAEMAYTSINAAIEAALELRRYHLMVNNIDLDVDLQPELPRTMADPYKIQQVILNLIVNAEQAMTGSGNSSRLVVKSEEAGGSIHVSVIDNGPGIAEENMNKIFDPFFTTKGAGRGNGTGTGLGLSISHSIVREHGGSLRAERAPSGGMTFVIELPVVGPEHEHAGPGAGGPDGQA